MTLLTPDNFHPYQHDSVTQLYEHEAILGVMPTGAGKTIVGLTAFAELQRDGFARKAVLLAPKRVANDVWPSEPAKWEQTQHLDVVPLIGSPDKRGRALRGPGDVFTLGLDNIKWLADLVAKWPDDDPRLDLLIVDEVSRCKSPRGVWSKSLRKIAKRFRTVWLLTGTPRPNSYLDYYVYVDVVGRGKTWPRSFDTWRRKFFYPTDYEQRVWEPHLHLLAELRADVARHSFKVPMSAVPRPASDPIVHRVTLPASARAAYKRMERELFAQVSGPDGTVDILAFNAAVSSGKLAQIAQGFLYDEDKTAHSVHDAKLGMLTELMDSNGGDASMLLYHFNEDLVRLRAAVPGLEYLGAGVSDQRAAELCAEWNAGNLEHLALHPASGGHGLNLQGTPAQLIHYCLTWSAELYEQVVARVARQGYVGTTGAQDWFVLNHHIVASDTVDEAKLSRVQGKLSAQAAAMQYIRSVQT